MCKNILIVDDDCDFIRKILDTNTERKFSFSIADSITRAKYLLNNNKFDLILANIKVPGGSSLELKDEIKKLKCNTNILFMSNIESDYDFVKDKGEKCYHKYDFNDSLGLMLENA